MPFQTLDGSGIDGITGHIRSADNTLIDFGTNSRPPIVVLTGDRRTGKTTACRRLANEAKALGWDTAGVISPAVFENGQKMAIDAIDLRSGQSRRLAWSRVNPEPGQLSYRFDAPAIEWANHLVASASPCDLLIIDELGPLEFEQGQGLISAFAALECGAYQMAVVVIRPELISAFLERSNSPCMVVDVTEFTAWEIHAGRSSPAASP